MPTSADDPAAFDPTTDAQFAALMSGDRFMDTVGAELVDWGVGHARIECSFTERHTNLVGTGHGAVLFTLGDTAMSIASNSHGRIAVAVRLDITFHEAVRVGDRVVAIASERSRSRRFGSYALDLTVGSTLVASMTGLTYRTDRWHEGTSAWPADWLAQR